MRRETLFHIHVFFFVIVFLGHILCEGFSHACTCTYRIYCVSLCAENDTIWALWRDPLPLPQVMIRPLQRQQYQQQRSPRVNSCRPGTFHYTGSILVYPRRRRSSSSRRRFVVVLVAVCCLHVIICWELLPVHPHIRRCVLNSWDTCNPPPANYFTFTSGNVSWINSMGPKLLCLCGHSKEDGMEEVVKVLSWMAVGIMWLDDLFNDIPIRN